MFLTRLYLNAARRGARKLIGSPQAMHAAVMASFSPQVHDETRGRPLWRLDPRPNSPALYIVSAAMPDLTHIVEQAGWPTTSEWETRDYSPILNSLTAGQRFSFRLAANPVRRSMSDASQGRGKVYAHVTAEQQRQWLIDRQEAIGISFLESLDAMPNVQLTQRERMVFHRKGARVTIAKAVFEGSFEVRDADMLREALTRGIGRAKAYGCGLMTLAQRN
ncbi:CRISPR system Cascade subunit CasE [Bowdeniella nasicola]|uniref:CRISPR system Cascade subunit CasE n=1 Tax=Bowdeniella nasicola TaxID=208480 RepID=A0A1H4CL43_9ACTO|nr:type I-E CRISPR-associated protein Cas6/Cse3/CasE [Bowdeniella nasicola]SEA61171.1 CRISPR system Cascade subunit CasE [Bowdeniella nasicola]